MSLHISKKNNPKSIFDRAIYLNFAKYILSCQDSEGGIRWEPNSKLDPWDHIESIMGLNFANEYESSKLAFDWLIKNQNQDGSWFSKYMDDIPIEKNKPTHFAPYISVAALHFYKIFSDKEYLEHLINVINTGRND